MTEGVWTMLRWMFRSSRTTRVIIPIWMVFWWWTRMRVDSPLLSRWHRRTAGSDGKQWRKRGGPMVKRRSLKGIGQTLKGWNEYMILRIYDYNYYYMKIYSKSYIILFHIIWYYFLSDMFSISYCIASHIIILWLFEK